MLSGELYKNTWLTTVFVICMSLETQLKRAVEELLDEI